MSNLEHMTLSRFVELLDAYGAELARFPEHERDAAQQLLARDAEAVRLREEAASLDGLLDSAPAHEPTPALRTRVAELPIRAPRGTRERTWLWGWSARNAWGAALAGAFMCSLGVVSGAWLGDDTEVAQVTDDATQSAASANTEDEGWDDLVGAALAKNFGKDL